MPKKDYNRYAILNSNSDTINTMPFIKIPVNKSDKFEYWNVQFSRMDKLAQKYYGNPFYDFLILYANPSFVSEFDIPDNTLIRIPFPLGKVLAIYEASIFYYKKQ